MRLQSYKQNRGPISVPFFQVFTSSFQISHSTPFQEPWSTKKNLRTLELTRSLRESVDGDYNTKASRVRTLDYCREKAKTRRGSYINNFFLFVDNKLWIYLSGSLRIEHSDLRNFGVARIFRVFVSWRNQRLIAGLFMLLKFRAWQLTQNMPVPIHFHWFERCSIFWWVILKYFWSMYI